MNIQPHIEPIDWNNHLPKIFTDTRFRKTSRRRYQFPLDGKVAGIVVAWKSVDYDNHAVNKPDLERLLEFKQDGSFAAAFVVLATINGIPEYGAHREAEELYETLKTISFRKGPHGDFWLLREDFSPFDAPELRIPF